MLALRTDKDVEEVKYVLKRYNSTAEKLDVTGTDKLFTNDAKSMNQVAVKAIMLII